MAEHQEDPFDKWLGLGGGQNHASIQGSNCMNGDSSSSLQGHSQPQGHRVEQPQSHGNYPEELDPQLDSADDFSQEKEDCFGDLVQLSFGKLGHTPNSGRSNKSLDSQSNINSLSAEDIVQREECHQVECPPSNKGVLVEDVSSDEDESDEESHAEIECDRSYNVEEMFPASKTDSAVADAAGSSSQNVASDGMKPSTFVNDDQDFGVNSSIDSRTEEGSKINIFDHVGNDSAKSPVMYSGGSWGSSYAVDCTAGGGGDEDDIKESKPSEIPSIGEIPKQTMKLTTESGGPSVLKSNLETGISAKEDPFQECQSAELKETTQAPQALPPKLSNASTNSTSHDTDSSNDPFKDCNAPPPSVFSSLPTPNFPVQAREARATNQLASDGNVGDRFQDCVNKNDSSFSSIPAPNFSGSYGAPYAANPTAGKTSIGNQTFGYYGQNSSVAGTSSYAMHSSSNYSSLQYPQSQSDFNSDENGADGFTVKSSLNEAGTQDYNENQGDYSLVFMDNSAKKSAMNSQSPMPKTSISAQTGDSHYFRRPAAQTQSLGIPKSLNQVSPPNSNSITVAHLNAANAATRRLHNASSGDASGVNLENYPRVNTSATITTAGSTNAEEEWSPAKITVRKVEENYGVRSYYDKSSRDTSNSSDEEETNTTKSNRNRCGSDDEEFQTDVEKRRKRTKAKFSSPGGKGRYSNTAYSNRSARENENGMIIHPGMVAYTDFDDEDDAKRHKKTSYKQMHKRTIVLKKPKDNKRMCIIIFLLLLLLVGVAMVIYFLFILDKGNEVNMSTDETNVNIDVDNTDHIDKGANSESTNDELSELSYGVGEGNATGAFIPTRSPVTNVDDDSHSNVPDTEYGENTTKNQEFDNSDIYPWEYNLTSEPNASMAATGLPSTAPTNATSLSETPSPSPTVFTTPTYSPTFFNSIAPTYLPTSWNSTLNETPTLLSTSTVNDTIVNSTNSSFLTDNASYNTSNSGESLQTSSGENLITGISKSYGIIFDVQIGLGLSYLKITGMELYLDTVFSSHYEVWTKKGSWKDSNGMYSDWAEELHEVAHGIISGAGACQPSHAGNCTFAPIATDEFESIEIIGERSRQSFYVTLTTDDLISQNYIRDSERLRLMDDVLYSSSAELDIFYGASILQFPLSLADPDTDFRLGRGFMGKIWYQAYRSDDEVGGLDMNITEFNNTDFMANTTQTQDFTFFNDTLQNSTSFAPSGSPSPSIQSVSPANDELPSGHSCFYYTEEACGQAAKALGLHLGGGGFPFAGKYKRSGCYFYSCSNCLYGGFAYFGNSGTKADMESLYAVDDEKQLSCETTLCDVSGQSSHIWCLLPNVGVCSGAARSFSDLFSFGSDYYDCAND